MIDSVLQAFDLNPPNGAHDGDEQDYADEDSPDSAHVLPEPPEHGQGHHRDGDDVLSIDSQGPEFHGTREIEGELLLNRDHEKDGSERDVSRNSQPGETLR